MSGRGLTHASVFDALGSRDFRVFWYGSLVLQVALSLGFFAIGWFVVQLARADGVPGRAALYAGVLGLAFSLPSVALGVVAGVVVDRVDRRAVVMAELVVGSLSVAGLAVLVMTGLAGLGWVLVYAVIAGMIGAFGRLARQAILPGLAEPSRLTSAVVLNSATLRFSMVVGPVIGGALIGSLGVGGLLLIAAVAGVVALALVARIPPQRAAGTGQHPGVLTSIRAGVVFMRDERFVRWQLLLLLAVTMLAYPLQGLLSAYATQVLGGGASAYAWLSAAVGLGGVVALAAPVIGARRGRGRVFVASCLGSGVALALFGLQRSLVPAFVLVASLACLMMSAAVLCTMIAQLTTPDELLGRVIGAQLLVVDLATAVGTLLLGAAGSAVGVGTTLTVAGVLLTVAAGSVFLRAPELRAVP